MSYFKAIALCLTASFVVSCGGGGSGGASDAGDEDMEAGDTGLSNPGSPSGSHRPGENCMSSGCHDGSNNSADEFFSAGTIFNSNGTAQTNATIRYFIHDTNTISATLETDNSGNFYSTRMIDGLSIGNGDLVSGIDVEVQGSSQTRTMPGLITAGGCSGCHGVDTSNVSVN
jgi:hypothetical protein